MTAIRVTVDDKHYTYVQSVPNNGATVIHNLGKYPAVTVRDTSGREVECDVQHLDLNTTRLTMSYVTSWAASFN